MAHQMPWVTAKTFAVAVPGGCFCSSCRLCVRKSFLCATGESRWLSDLSAASIHVHSIQHTVAIRWFYWHGNHHVGKLGIWCNQMRRENEYSKKVAYWKSVNSHHVSGWKKGRLARASNGPDAAFLQSMHVSSCINFIQLPIQSIWLIVTLSKGINDVDYIYRFRYRFRYRLQMV